MVSHTRNPSTWEMETENEKFKFILNHTASSRPAWATWNLVGKKVSLSANYVNKICLISGPNCDQLLVGQIAETKCSLRLLTAMFINWLWFLRCNSCTIKLPFGGGVILYKILQLLTLIPDYLIITKNKTPCSWASTSHFSSIQPRAVTDLYSISVICLFQACHVIQITQSTAFCVDGLHLA